MKNNSQNNKNYTKVNHSCIKMAGKISQTKSQKWVLTVKKFHAHATSTTPYVVKLGGEYGQLTRHQVRQRIISWTKYWEQTKMRPYLTEVCCKKNDSTRSRAVIPRSALVNQSSSRLPLRHGSSASVT